MKETAILFFGLGFILGLISGVHFERQEIYDICTTTGELWINSEAFYCVPVIRE
jgi:hypothetical protein